MKQKLKFFLGLQFFLSLCASAQQEKNYRFIFYNVENLFDTLNDPTIRDDEFTPSGNRNWNYYRYQRKLHHTAKALLFSSQWQDVAAIGLAEIENKNVLTDLVNTPELKKLNYNVIHFDSPDRRGIDVALLYQEEHFMPLEYYQIPVKSQTDSSFKTRDILYCKAKISTDTLYWFMCHWPSRYGGQKSSEPKRILAAETLRYFTDSIFLSNPKANILIGGDFNDEPYNESLRVFLKAGSVKDSTKLINLMTEEVSFPGSHKYQGHWSYLDQIIISKALWRKCSNKSGFEPTASVCEEEPLLEEDSKYTDQKPLRTFNGYRYKGGFSDHLPIFLDISHEVFK